MKLNQTISFAVTGVAAFLIGWQIVGAAPWSISFPIYSMTYDKADPVSGMGPARRVEGSVFEFTTGTGPGRFVDGSVNVTSIQPIPPFPIYTWSATMTPPLLWWSVSPKAPPYNFYVPDHYTGVKDPDLNVYSWSGTHVVTD